LLQTGLAASELLLPPLTGAADFHLLLAHLHRRAVAQVAQLATPVTALHQLGALVLAAGHLLLLLCRGCQVLSTLPEQVGQATVALDLDIRGAGLTRWRMTGQRARMWTASRPGHLTLCLALLTVDPGTDLVCSVPHLVTVPSTAVVTTGQGPATLSTTGGRLGNVAGPGGCFVLPQTGDRHRGVARWAWELGDLNNWGFHFPGTYWLCVVYHLHWYIIMAAGGAGVATWQVLITDLLTCGTGGWVAVVPVPHWVMAVRCHTARLLAPGWLGVLPPTTGHNLLGVLAVAGQLHCCLAGVARSPVTT